MNHAVLRRAAIATVRTAFTTSTRALLATSACALLAVPTAHAATVFLSDDFNAENGGVGAAEYSGFANWTVANVDLLATGYFFNLCQAAGGTSTCVDMEGSGNGSMTTRTAYALTAGTASIRFDLAGDQRGRGNNAVTVSLVTTLGATLFSESFALGASDPFTTFSRDIAITDTANVFVKFLSTGPADSMGLLLDNVVFSAGEGGVVVPPVTTVPEPSSAWLLGLGLLGVAGLKRGMRRLRA